MTFGEELYADYARSGQRSRFGYSTVQVLKKVESLEDLRRLCEDVSGETFADDVAPQEMLEACVVRDPDRNDLEAYGSAIADTGEGCLLGVIAIPVIVTGIVVGRLLDLCGIDLKLIYERHKWPVFLVAVAGAGAAIGGYHLNRNVDWLWLGTLPGILVGLVMAFGRQGKMGLQFWPIFLTTPMLAYLVATGLAEEIPLWPLAGALFAVPTGYGMCRTTEEMMTRQRGRAHPAGTIRLEKIETPD